MSSALKKGFELYKERQFLQAKAAHVLDPSCLENFNKHLEDAYKNNDLSVLSYVLNSVDSLRSSPEYNLEILNKDPLFASFTNILSPRKIENKEGVPNIFENSFSNENNLVKESKQDFLENYFKSKTTPESQETNIDKTSQSTENSSQNPGVNFVLK